MDLWIDTDFEIEVSVIDRRFLITYLLNCVIEKKEVLVIIKDLKGEPVAFYNYVYFDIYVPAVTSDGTRKIVKVRRGARVVDNLLINILIFINILVLEGIDLLFDIRKILLLKCGNLTADSYVIFR